MSHLLHLVLPPPPLLLSTHQTPSHTHQKDRETDGKHSSTSRQNQNEVAVVEPIPCCRGDGGRWGGSDVKRLPHSRQRDSTHFNLVMGMETKNKSLSKWTQAILDCRLFEQPLCSMIRQKYTSLSEKIFYSDSFEICPSSCS